MLRTVLTFNLLLTSLLLCQGQSLNLQKKQLKAYAISEAPTIDGQLDEGLWQEAPIASGFVQERPRPGKAATQKTTVRVAYDNSGIYIGARMYEPHPDSILRELSQRDDLGNTDWFGIFIDAYRDGNNGVGFIVTPAGIQVDLKYSAFGDDENWDAVWESAARIDSKGWVAEINIPYSAIRFPDAEEQVWHVNFGRLIRRRQQQSYWNPVDPEMNGFLNQAGYLRNIRNIESPVRLQAMPFLTLRADHRYDPAEKEKHQFGNAIGGGMDVKYGITDAFTLDMTLIPDFSEAQSDNQVLNLSPFEVRFDENRQFFTEGTELFNKGGLFYSRRVGGRPFYASEVSDQLEPDEEILSNPSRTQLLNASKISGRTRNGLGIGFFNAVAGREFAQVVNSEGEKRRIQTNPLTNYNVFVLDQNLQNNSFVSLINTNVWRSGVAYEANVTGTQFELRNRANTYSVEGSAKLSQKYFTTDTDLGHAYNIELGKISGNFQFSAEYSEESDTYDINDLGFQFNNNERDFRLRLRYRIYEPFWKLNRLSTGVNLSYGRLYDPSVYTSSRLSFWAWTETQNFWDFNVWFNARPFATYDYFEPRVDGRFYRQPTRQRAGFRIGTDGRKRFRLSLRSGFSNFGEPGRYSLDWEVAPRFRVNDKLTFALEVSSDYNYGDVGYVNQLESKTPPPSETKKSPEPDVIFGRRDRTTVVNEFNTKYTFTNRMELTLRTRHYWSQVQYDGFHLLGADGRLDKSGYQDEHNTNFNAFNVDMVYRWRFAPGSDILLVWKQAILDSEEQAVSNYFDNVNGLFNNPQSNQLSLKIVYFLDYVNVFG